MTAPLDTGGAPRAEIVSPKVLDWSARIGAAWETGVRAILETGRLLAAARADCAHGEWQQLIAELPFGERHAHRLRALAGYEPFRTHVSDLPTDVYTLAQLARLPEARFELLLARGVIHPAMPRTDATALTRAETVAADRARVANLVPVAGTFTALVVDPPWEDDWMSPAARLATPYATLSDDEIADIDVAAWAAELCHLYLWIPNNRVGIGVDLMRHWGFEHKSMLTWRKPRFGRGHYFRNRTEHVLFGVKGNLATRADDIATDFEGPQGAHSEKPESFYEIVRRASWEPFGEAFQCQPRPDFRNLFEEVP